MLISIIIPCRNEEKRIGKTLHAIHDYLSTQTYDYEIIIVNNGSIDRTAYEVEKCSKTIPHIRLLTENAYGKGWAVKQGMLHARGDWKLMTDADNSTDISHLGEFIRRGQEGADVIISSRRLKDSDIKNPQPWQRRVLGNIFAGVVRLIVPTGVKDTQNGFKLFSKRASEEIFNRQTIFYWAFDIEVLHIARKLNYQILELPITWIDDDRSQMNIKGMMRMLLEVFTIRFNAYREVAGGLVKQKQVAKPKLRVTLW